MQNEPDDDDEYIDIQPWPVQVLVGRLVSFATLGRRGIIEAEAADEVDDLVEVETDRFDLQSWAALELQPWLSAEEVRILRTPVTELTDEDLASCSDALSASVAVAWTVRVIPADTLPMPAGTDDERRVLEWSPKPWTKVRDAARAARVRSDEELANEREKWDIVLWRFSLFRDQDDALRDRAALADAIAEASSAGLLRTDGTDFLTDAGVPFAQMTDDEQSELEHLAAIRLRTLNWVCGFGEDWESAPLFLD
jgi:hypothetical protein